MFLAPVALALLFTPDLSAVSTRFGTPAMLLPGGNLFLTPDGKFATDGETWVDLATEKAVQPAIPCVTRRLQLLLGDGNFVLERAENCVTRHSGMAGEFLTTLEVQTDDRIAFDPSGRKLARRQIDETGSRVQLAGWPTGHTAPAWADLATTAGRVLFMLFNPSGSHLIWAEGPLKSGTSGEPTVWVCEVSTGKAVRLQHDPAHRHLAGLALSDDGKRAAVLSAAYTDLFDAVTGEFLRSAPHPERRMHVGYGYPHPTFTPNGKYLLACELHPRKLSRIPTDPTAEVGFVDVSDGDGVKKFALTPDGERAVVQDESGVVRSYDLVTGKRADAGIHDTWTGVARGGEHRAVCWSRRGRVAAWDTRTGKLEKDWLIGKPDAESDGVGWVKVSPDGRLMAVTEYGANAKRFRVYDLGTGKAVLELPDKYAPAEIAFHPNGDSIGVGTVQDKDSRSRMTFRVFTLSDGRERTVFGGPVGVPAFAPDGRTVLVFTLSRQSDEREDWVRCIETTTGGERWMWKGEWGSGLADRGNGLVGTTPDGTPFAAWGNTVRGFDPLTGKARWVIDREDRQNHSPHFAASVDGRWLAVTDSVDWLHRKGGGWFELYALDSQTGRDHPLASPVVPGTTFRGVAVSGDGERVLTLSDTGEQMVWDVEKLRQTVADPWLSAWPGLDGKAGEAAKVMSLLKEDPERAVKVLGQKLSPVAEPNVADVKRWLGELGSDDFKTREAAERSLETVLDPARRLILAAAEKPINAEAGERLERLVARINHFPLSSESQRVVRAVEVVERLRTPAAVKLLERWAGGAPEALLTTEAKASLKRVKQ